jgi:Fe-S cluster biogenesis protein NfuA
VETNDPDATGPQRAAFATTLSDETSAVPDAAADALSRLCRDVLSPLVAADGGVMYLVKAPGSESSGDDVHIHLTGTCAGCPGASLTRDGIIAPAVRTVLPKARVIVTTGPLVPEGAKRV